MMNEKNHEQIVLEIFRRAIEDQPIPDGPHIVEDEELLACWCAGLLGPSDHDRIAQHLAACPYCRSTLAEMIKQGLLTSPESEPEGEGPGAVDADSVSLTPVESEAAPLPATIPPLAKPWYRTPWAAMILAASILLCLGTLFWLPTTESLLAQAESDLQSGRYAAALDTTERVFKGELTPSQIAQARDLAEQSGYQLADSALRSGDFPRVMQLDDRVSRLAGPTGSMTSLRLQAERGVSNASALDANGTLVDYGYDFRGESDGIKDVKPSDVTITRVKREFEEAIAQYPDSISLLVNYGQLMFEYRPEPDDVEKPKELFAAALELDPDNPDAHLGLGLVAFEEKRFDDALEHFKEAVRLNPENATAQMNLAICYEKLGKSTEARTHWERVEELAEDPKLREDIERFLNPEVRSDQKEGTESSKQIDLLLEESQ